MKLNGWLRLWIVLSAVWILFVVSLAYSNLSSLLESHHWATSKEGVGTVTFVFSASEPEDFVQRYINEELLPLVEKDPTSYVGKIDSSHYNKLIKTEFRPRLLKYVGLGILPVILTIIVAWLYLWVRRGFQLHR